MSVKKVSDRVTRVLNDYSYRVTNRIPVPEFLQKQVNGIWQFKDDPERGLAMFIEGLQQEKEVIEEVENSL